MEYKSLEIKTVPVTIRVVEVGGKRMSLSVFKQIQDDYFFSDEYDGVAIFLGWVDYGGNKHILFSYNGNLMKDTFEIEHVSSFTELQLKAATEHATIARKCGYAGWDKDAVENRLKVAIEKHLSEKQFCELCNRPYYDLMTPETQVFISI